MPVTQRATNSHRSLYSPRRPGSRRGLHLVIDFSRLIQPLTDRTSGRPSPTLSPRVLIGGREIRRAIFSRRVMDRRRQSCHRRRVDGARDRHTQRERERERETGVLGCRCPQHSRPEYAALLSAPAHVLPSPRSGP